MATDPVVGATFRSLDNRTSMGASSGHPARSIYVEVSGATNGGQVMSVAAPGLVITQS
jgi:hypothetical protein